MSTTQPYTYTYTPPPLPPPFTTSPAHLLAQGAEARLYKTHYLTPSIPAALKVRPSKPYRHPILDRRLSRQRILQEARCLVKLAREEVPVPGVLGLDVEGGGDGDVNNESGSGGGSGGGWAAWLLMEWVEGVVVRQVVDQWEKWLKAQRQQQQQQQGGDYSIDNNAEEQIKKSEEEVCALLRNIGRAVGAMHKAGIVHGDLTTSNLILRPANAVAIEKEKEANQLPAPVSEDLPASTSILQDAEMITTDRPEMDGEVVLIDFGLAGQSVQDEDRAVDLYVLERAFGSSHPRTEPFFEEVIRGYAESYRGAKVVLKKLEQVRMRGRKRSMIG
ncbi:serine/threonine-protein kinase bud32 [Onygenales sp. PD_40]|nr:serine/threonine-protein kinase bud32 [Onygenales sp. PD_40]